MSKDQIIEITIELILFLIASYFIFYKSWLKSLGRETAKLSTRKDLTRIEQEVKKEFNEKIEALRASLAKENIGYQIQFEFLHKKRAIVIINLYQKLQELNSAMLEWTSRLQIVHSDAEKEEKERGERANNAINNFRNYFYMNKLLLSPEFCKQIEQIFQEYWNKAWDFSFAKERVKRKNVPSDYIERYYESLTKLSDDIKNKLPQMLNEIENESRNILSVKESE